MKKTLSFLSTIMVVLSFVSCSSFSSKKVEGYWWHNWGADGYDYVYLKPNGLCDYDFGQGQKKDCRFNIDNKNLTISLHNNYGEEKTLIYDKKRDVLVEPDTGYEMERMPKEYSDEMSREKSIEEVMYQRHGDYALFKSDYTINNKQIWAVFLKEEEMVIFINSNDIQRRIKRGLRYEYEIRGNKLRFYNGYEVYGLENANVNHYPETSAEIFLDGRGVTFANMKQYGNRHNIHISATLSNESLSNEGLNYIKKYARENIRGWNKNNYY